MITSLTIFPILFLCFYVYEEEHCFLLLSASHHKHIKLVLFLRLIFSEIAAEILHHPLNSLLLYLLHHHR